LWLCGQRFGARPLHAVIPIAAAVYYSRCIARIVPLSSATHGLVITHENQWP
jgi:hypothetical protein